jgi:hypothetical protein
MSLTKTTTVDQITVNENGVVSAELNATNLPTSTFEVGGTLSYITD